MKKKHISILIFIYGLLYMDAEIFWKAAKSLSITLKGETSIHMFFIGGVSMYLVGLLNEKKKRNLPITIQTIIGGTIITLIEFVSGYILNIILGMKLWTYDNSYNLMHQVCLQYALLWTFLVPITIFIDDYIRHLLLQEEKPKSLLYNYKELFIWPVKTIVKFLKKLR